MIGRSPSAPRQHTSQDQGSWKRTPRPNGRVAHRCLNLSGNALRGELSTESDALLFPGRKGGHLPLGEYRWVFDRALVTVRDAAEAERRQELADDGEVRTLTYLRFATGCARDQ